MQNIKTTAKDFFLQVGAIIALYVSAGSLIALLYQLINYSFPDKLAYYSDPYSSGIRFAIASLIVIFPLYLFLGSILQRDYKKNPEKRDLSIRKVLVYLTLFVSSALIVGYLIALINTFLSGEITVRFVLKVLVTMGVAGMIFGYYVSDLRKPENSMRNVKIFGLISAVFVIASIVFGFTIMGSPAKQRMLKFDMERVSDLEEVQYQVINYWQNKGSIPQSLGDLNNSISGYKVPTDPKNDDAYTYKVIDKKTFELCANFELGTPSTEGKGEYRDSYAISYPSMMSQGDWKHGEGEKCFERTIDEDYYPVGKERI